jgi:hypothetical protein
MQAELKRELRTDSGGALQPVMVTCLTLPVMVALARAQPAAGVPKAYRKCCAKQQVWTTPSVQTCLPARCLFRVTAVAIKSY